MNTNASKRKVNIEMKNTSVKVLMKHSSYTSLTIKVGQNPFMLDEAFKKP